AEHLRRDHGQHDADRAEGGDECEGPLVRTEEPDHPREALAEVGGLAGSHRVPIARVEARLLCALGVEPLLFCHRLVAHASTPSCDSTISRYVSFEASSSSWVPMPTMRPSSSTTMRSASVIVEMR